MTTFFFFFQNVLSMLSKIFVQFDDLERIVKVNKYLPSPARHDSAATAESSVSMYSIYILI